MNIDDIIQGRRTVKKFSTRSVSFERIAEILEAGTYAPSSGNVQNWQFVVVTDKKKKKELVSICDGQKVIEEAPVLIAVFSKEQKIKTLFGSRSEVYSTQNCAACIQNMLLKAYSLEMGTCWIGTFDSEKVNELLSVDGGKLQAIICVGYPERLNQLSREPLQYKVFFEKWDEKERDIGLWPISKPISRSLSKLRNFIDRTKKRS